MEGADELVARPRASIRAYVDRELVVRGADDRWALESEGTMLGWLTEPTRERPGECVTLDGRWEIELDRAHRLVMRAGASVVAMYRSGFWPGGPVTLVDGSRFSLRPPLWGEWWKLRRRGGPLVLRVAGRNCVRFGGAARDLYELPLLTVLALEAVMLEARLPISGSSVAPGPS